METVLFITILLAALAIAAVVPAARRSDTSIATELLVPHFGARRPLGL
jgi:hypothetical protein